MRRESDVNVFRLHVGEVEGELAQREVCLSGILLWILTGSLKDTVVVRESGSIQKEENPKFII